jgi:hypothetical protein
MDHVEPKMEIQMQQVRLVFGGPQASSCEDANIVVIKASPDASNPILRFCYNFILFSLWFLILH